MIFYITVSIILVVLIILRRQLRETYGNIILTSGPKYGNKNPLMLSERPNLYKKLDPKPLEVEEVEEVEEERPIVCQDGVTRSARLGGPGGRRLYKEKCSDGSYLTGFEINSDNNGISALQGRCSNGETLKKIGMGIPDKTFDCLKGVQEIPIKVNKVGRARIIGTLKICDKQTDGKSTMPEGSQVMRCRKGEKAVGYFGKDGGYIDSMGLLCAKCQ